MGFMYSFKNTVFLWLLMLLACGNGHKIKPAQPDPASTSLRDFNPEPVVPAANRTGDYLPLLRDKKVGIVANQTSVIFKSLKKAGPADASYAHLVDSLLSLGVDVRKVFAPEHGFRGMADAGEHIKDGRDAETGLPIFSLYGTQRKPGPELLEDLDIILFDIQDVGVRFYTYIATLQLVMEACADAGLQIVVLDRPNPNGHYIDGPTMEPEHKGFLGLTPIPLVYGMTIGEYARMINGEGWLEGGIKAKLHVVALQNYTHTSGYSLPIRPSPNLPNDQAISLYPGLGLFEGTNINAGRGTEFQFQRYGAPFLDSTAYSFSYVPEANFGAKSPKHLGKRCFGKDLSEIAAPSEVSLKWLIDAYKYTADKSLFFNTSGFTKHAGTQKLQQQIESGWPEEKIRAGWQVDLNRFKKIRAGYLLYE